MGLNRYFEIYVEDKDKNEINDPDLASRVLKAIEAKYDWWEGSLHCGGEITTYDANWYDVDEDMMDVSEQFPDLVFTVICTGETSDDTWTGYFCNGRGTYSYLEWVPEDRQYLLTGECSYIKQISLTVEERKLLMKALSEYSLDLYDPEITAYNNARLAQLKQLYKKLQEVG